MITLQGIFKKYDRRVWNKFMWIRVRRASGELRSGKLTPSWDFDIIYFFIFLIH